MFHPYKSARKSPKTPKPDVPQTPSNPITAIIDKYTTPVPLRNPLTPKLHVSPGSVSVITTATHVDNPELYEANKQIKLLKKQLSEEIAIYKRKLIDAESTKGMTELQLQEMKIELEKVSSDRQFLLKRDKELSQKISSLQQEHSSYKSSSDNQVLTLTQDNNRLRDQLSQLREELQDIRREHNRVNTSSITAHESKLLLLQQQIENQQQLINVKDQQMQRLSTANNYSPPKPQNSASATDVSVLTKMLSEQSQKIKSYESQLQKSNELIKHYHAIKENTTRIKEEKHTLELKLSQYELMKEKLADLETENYDLNEEKRNFLRMLNGIPPNDVLKTISEQRDQILILTEQLGAQNYDNQSHSAEISIRDAQIAELQQTCKNLEARLADELQSSKKVEKSKVLIDREIKFLREQIKSYELEQNVMAGGNADFDTKDQRIKYLETLLDEYKKEIVGLEESLRQIPENSHVQLTELIAEKRKHEKTISELEIKVEKLQELIDQGHYNPETTRVLQLAQNPESQEYSLRKSVLDALKAENEALRKGFTKSLPFESYTALQLEYSHLLNQVAEKDKRIDRLRTVFQTKATEFREAVFELLGYQIDVLPTAIRILLMNEVEIMYDRQDGSIQVDERVRQLLKTEYDMPTFFAVCLLYLHGIQVEN